MEKLSRAEILGITVFGILAVTWFGTVLFGMYSHSSEKPVEMSKPNEAISKVPEKIVVHVSGAVQSPGLYEIKPGARIDDVIREAGGTSPNADTSFLNLAETILDGQKIYIPVKGEEIKAPLVTKDESIKKSKPASPAIKFPINLNTASASALEALPGIGETRAKDIIDYRTRNGGFKKVSDIRNVKGIGEKTYEKIKDLIYV